MCQFHCRPATATHPPALIRRVGGAWILQSPSFRQLLAAAHPRPAEQGTRLCAPPARPATARRGLPTFSDFPSLSRLCSTPANLPYRHFPSYPPITDRIHSTPPSLSTVPPQPGRSLPLLARAPRARAALLALRAGDEQAASPDLVS